MSASDPSASRTRAERRMAAISDPCARHWPTPPPTGPDQAELRQTAP
jgi:hypothetical protein